MAPESAEPEAPESRGEKVESRNSQRHEYLHGFLVVDSPSYLLPSTRSTLYLLIPWLFGLSAFSRLLQRDGRWAEIEPVRNRLITECRKHGVSKPDAQAWTYSELNRTNVYATYPEPKQDKRPKGESITSSSASWPSAPLYQTTSRSPSCLAPVLRVGRVKTDLRHENRSRRPRC